MQFFILLDKDDDNFYRYTDDTEMAHQLAKSLVKNKGFVIQKVAKG